ncbi:MAG TPA: NUDIX domain-containing protein [Acidimicrobiales bacterium]|nr:NUDIX domain-containing protein [Acidimicrobiales bacterium]
MPKYSAGLLLYRRDPDRGLELLIVHPGGPFWQNKDGGAWSVPKGEHEEGEDPWTVARREFEEELGHAVPPGDRLDLGVARQRSGKRVHCFAVAGNLDVRCISSNTFTIEWPPRSGVLAEFPEVDRAAWVSPEVARVKLLAGQAPFVDLLVEVLDRR